MFDFYNGKKPRDVPAYTITRGARILNMSPSTLRSWVKDGYTAEGKARQRIIIPAQSGDDRATRLSFVNLAEAFVLTSIRKDHHIQLGKVRKTLAFLEKELAAKHPLVTHKFATSGVALFVEMYGKLVEIDKAGQAQIRSDMDVMLGRIQYVDGFASRLYPIVRKGGHVDVDAPRVIVIDPSRAFGAPVVDGTGIAVDTLRKRFQAGDSMGTLTDEFGIAGDRIEEALRAAA